MIFDAEGRPVEQNEVKPDGMVEVARSFSFKLNLGNYESCDFFCSQKAQCKGSEVEETSRDLFEFCMDQVMQSVKEVKARRAKKEEQSARRVA